MSLYVPPLSPQRASMIRPTSILAEGVQGCGVACMRSANVKRILPHIVKAGTFDESDSKADYMCPRKVLALAT